MRCRSLVCNPFSSPLIFPLDNFQEHVMLTPVQNHASDPSEAFLFLRRCSLRINNLRTTSHRNPSP